MTSLRETLETTFAATAFAERDLPQEARALSGDTAKHSEAARARRPEAKRPRPGLKA